MAGLARLSHDRDLAGSPTVVPLGLGLSAGARLDVLDPRPCHRHPAAGSADAAFARRALSRLPVAHQHLLPAATARERSRGNGQVSVTARVIDAAERVPLPDFLIRAAIDRLCWRTAVRLAAGDVRSDEKFARDMAARAIAEHADAANAQHYEVPAAFFARVLGPNRKYSSCFYRNLTSTLQEAEEEALRQTAEHAGLADGQTILELGCGWGSLSLFMARRFPKSKIVAVSN